ncbi:unnamed protein product, partial [Polarella glacialis]
MDAAVVPTCADVDARADLQESAHRAARDSRSSQPFVQRFSPIQTFAHIQMCCSYSVCHRPAGAKDSLPFPTRLAPNTIAPSWDLDLSSPSECLMDASRIFDGCELMPRGNMASPDSQNSQLTCSADFFCFWKHFQLGAAAAARLFGTKLQELRPIGRRRLEFNPPDPYQQSQTLLESLLTHWYVGRPTGPSPDPWNPFYSACPFAKGSCAFTVLRELALIREPSSLEGLTSRPRFADSEALTRADAERPELASWEQQLTVPSAPTYYDAHDMPALSSSRIWHATRKHRFYNGFAITLDLSLLLRTLGKYSRRDIPCAGIRCLVLPAARVVLDVPRYFALPDARGRCTRLSVAWHLEDASLASLLSTLVGDTNLFLIILLPGYVLEVLRIASAQLQVQVASSLEGRRATTAGISEGPLGPRCCLDIAVQQVAGKVQKCVASCQGHVLEVLSDCFGPGAVKQLVAARLQVASSLEGRRATTAGISEGPLGPRCCSSIAVLQVAGKVQKCVVDARPAVYYQTPEEGAHVFLSRAILRMPPLQAFFQHWFGTPIVAGKVQKCVVDARPALYYQTPEEGAHVFLSHAILRTEMKSLISFGVIGSGSQFRGLEQSRSTGSENGFAITLDLSLLLRTLGKGCTASAGSRQSLGRHLGFT